MAALGSSIADPAGQRRVALLGVLAPGAKIMVTAAARRPGTIDEGMVPGVGRQTIALQIR